MRRPRAGFGREEEGGYWQEHKFSRPRNPLFAAQRGKMVMDAMPLFYAGHLSYLTSDFQPTILFPCLGLSFVFFFYISLLTFFCYSVFFIRLFLLLHFVSLVLGFLVSFSSFKYFPSVSLVFSFPALSLSFSFPIILLFHFTNSCLFFHPFPFFSPYILINIFQVVIVENSWYEYGMPKVYHKCTVPDCHISLTSVTIPLTILQPSSS